MSVDESLDWSRWGNGPGDRYGTHDHDYDKVIVVESGSIRFVLPGEGIDLEAGDRLELPAGTAHAAIVGPTGVSCREAHLPSGGFRAVSHRPAGTW